MDGLHGGDHAQLRQAWDVIRMQDLHVLDPMAQMRQALLGFIAAQLLVGVQHFMIGAVADGVHGHAQPHIGCAAAQLEELLAVQVQDALFSGSPA